MSGHKKHAKHSKHSTTPCQSSETSTQVDRESPCSTHRLLENNRVWAHEVASRDPSFFPTLAQQQSPEYLWIGCSDSRVPSNQIVGLLPGEIFVHRNVANMVLHSDLNCLSVMQFAIENLMVKHIIVCGHYNCGGVKAAMEGRKHGLIDNWLRNIKDIYRNHQAEIDALPDRDAQVNRLCELNVCQQVRNVAHTTMVQSAWSRGQPLAIHGWCYGLQDGLIRNLGVTVCQLEQVDPLYRVDGIGLTDRLPTSV